MNTTRIALAASGAAVVAWTAKAVAIGLAGGLGRSPWEGPLFLVGSGCLLIAVTSTALSFAAGRGAAVRTAAVVAGLAIMVGATLLLNGVIGQVEPADPGWAWSEVNLWVLAVAALVTAGWGSLRAAPAR